MSDTALKEIIDRATKDEKFRNQLFTDPEKALAGYELSDEDRETLENINADNFDQFAGGLGDRSTKGLWSIGTG
ncbi:MAG: Franean1_4349 family RiPP [Anaerolineae bacterium]|nr:Franean1_4349 family RiPP [Anaerolineae bacterium]